MRPTSRGFPWVAATNFPQIGATNFPWITSREQPFYPKMARPTSRNHVEEIQRVVRWAVFTVGVFRGSGIAFTQLMWPARLRDCPISRVTQLVGNGTRHPFL